MKGLTNPPGPAWSECARAAHDGQPFRRRSWEWNSRDAVTMVGRVQARPWRSEEV